MEVGCPLGVLDQPRGVVNQVNLNTLLNIGNRDGKILEQVCDAHALSVRYEEIHDVGEKTYPIRIIGDHVSVLPDYGGYI